MLYMTYELSTSCNVCYMYVILSDRAVSSTCMHADANLKNVINDDCNVTDHELGRMKELVCRYTVRRPAIAINGSC